MKNTSSIWLTAWYGHSKWIYCLLPLSWLFHLIVILRKFYLIHFSQKSLSVPVIVVGNISIGGTGKTPLIIAMAKYLREQGYVPGVVSRGYGGRAKEYPYLLDTSSTAKEAGDEPILIFNAAGCPVCIAPDRTAAAERLVSMGCTVILSDDGLQHYRLGRRVEIAVVDGQRLLGNQQLLPVGPLREPVSRLTSVDFVVVNQPDAKGLNALCPHYVEMNIQPSTLTNILSEEKFPLSALINKKNVHAVAGIGNPGRFFKTLDQLNIVHQQHAFPDHYPYTAADFNSFNDQLIIMTEKDAVKCKAYARPTWFSLGIEALLPELFWQALTKKLDSFK